MVECNAQLISNTVPAPKGSMIPLLTSCRIHTAGTLLQKSPLKVMQYANMIIYAELARLKHKQIYYAPHSLISLAIKSRNDTKALHFPSGIKSVDEDIGPHRLSVCIFLIRWFTFSKSKNMYNASNPNDCVQCFPDCGHLVSRDIHKLRFLRLSVLHHEYTMKFIIRNHSVFMGRTAMDSGISARPFPRIFDQKLSGVPWCLKVRRYIERRQFERIFMASDLEWNGSQLSIVAP